MVSRVTMRIRRAQFSHDIRQSVVNTDTKETPLLSPNKKGLQLFSHRAALIPHLVKSRTASTKQWLEDRKEAKIERKKHKEEAVVEKPKEVVPITEATIQQPRKAWRERVSQWSEKSKGKLSTITHNVSDKVPRRIRIGSPTAGGAALPSAVKTRALELEQDQDQGEDSKIKLVRVQKKTEAQVVEEERRRKPEVMQETKVVKAKELQKRALSIPSGPLGQAITALQDQQYDQAEDILVPYIVQHSRDAKAYMLLGKAALGKQAWEEALEIFEQVLAIDDSLSGVRAVLGHAALKMGKMTLALSSLQRAHDEDPSDVQVLQDLLTIAQRMDNKVLERSVKENMSKIEFESIREQAKEPVR